MIVFGDRFRRCSVDDSRIRSKIAPFSVENGLVWAGPEWVKVHKQLLHQSPLHALRVNSVIHFSQNKRQTSLASGLTLQTSDFQVFYSSQRLPLPQFDHRLQSFRTSTKIGSKNRVLWEIRGKILKITVCIRIRLRPGKWHLVRVVGRIENSRIQEIGIPL